MQINEASFDSLKMLPFMKSKEFVKCFFFEALDEIAVTHCQPGVLRLIILTSDVGFPHFLMKKALYCLQNAFR